MQKYTRDAKQIKRIYFKIKSMIKNITASPKQNFILLIIRFSGSINFHSGSVAMNESKLIR